MQPGPMENIRSTAVFLKSSNVAFWEQLFLSFAIHVQNGGKEIEANVGTAFTFIFMMSQPQPVRLRPASANRLRCFCSNQAFVLTQKVDISAMLLRFDFMTESEAL